jgi:hypothetical protein
VTEFFGRLSADGWLDHEYNPESAWRMLKSEGQVEQASLEQVKSMLTFCVRGERFSDGHWADMIEAGHIHRLLTRLQYLNKKTGLEETGFPPTIRG